MSDNPENIVLVLGDQLDTEHAAIQAADPARDRIVMIECVEEGSHVASHKHRTVLFLSAMRHFAESKREEGWRVEYTPLDAGRESIVNGLATTFAETPTAALWAVEPGEWRLKDAIERFAAEHSIPLRWFEDSHFLASHERFEQWASKRKQLTMEFFYREERKRLNILMDGDQPLGGEWNYDKDNRKSFPKKGPGALPAIPRFEPDAMTREVIDAVNTVFPDHPGRTDNFSWPVTRAQALSALHQFIDERLIGYGRYQDAMWQSEPFLYHALISSSINLKLLNPREVVAAAVEAHQDNPDTAPLSAVEGFVRQIIGWREFIRGVYWLKMPEYRSRNHFDHQQPLPEWFWTANTEMNCLRQSIGDTLENGYAHHIQRLMIIGNYATLAGLLPQAVCDWYLGIYVDAIEWVELPNTLGMALHGDGGVVGSKPYVASGSYINRMSNYCDNCRFNVKARSGDDACPFNTLYWDFLRRHRAALGKAPRMNMVLKNLDRWEASELDAISERAASLRDQPV
ncbi:MAG: cryptochrome/photolyase family protein [Pseudomonadota bacterium]